MATKNPPLFELTLDTETHTTREATVDVVKIKAAGDVVRVRKRRKREHGKR